jgi:signal transduction histidine kinase
MDHILETLMAAARADAGLDRGRSDVAASLRRLATTWEPALAKRGAVLVLRSPDGPLEAGVDAEVVERIVTPLLHNAARYAGAEVALTARRDNGAVVVEVSDDGPGIPATAREQVFDPGHRRAGHDGDDGHGGAGLGLALARRLARAAGGDVVASDPPDDTPGARLRVVLPA